MKNTVMMIAGAALIFGLGYYLGNKKGKSVLADKPAAPLADLKTDLKAAADKVKGNAEAAVIKAEVLTAGK